MCGFFFAFSASVRTRPCASRQARYFPAASPTERAKKKRTLRSRPHFPPSEALHATPAEYGALVRQTISPHNVSSTPVIAHTPARAMPKNPIDASMPLLRRNLDPVNATSGSHTG